MEAEIFTMTSVHNYIFKKHSKNVNKYIILHDTTLFGINDEFIYDHASDVVKNMKSNKSGLKSAVSDFIYENQNWKIDTIYENNNGLTVLKKII